MIPIWCHAVRRRQTCRGPFNEPCPAGTASVLAMTTRPVLCQTVLDAQDARSLAEFHRQFLGLEYRAGDEPPGGHEPDDADWLVLLAPDGSRRLAIQRTEQLTPTTWPDPGVPMQMHLDMTVPDVASLDAAGAHALALGARLLLDRRDDPEEPTLVFADPAGHPFCVFVA